MAKKEKIICPITKMECDSNDEMYFIWWLEDCKNKGFINSYERSMTYSLSDNVTYKEFDGKKFKDKVLLLDHKYTPDFNIYWNESALNIFYSIRDKVYIYIPFIIHENNKFIPNSVVEIKGDLSQRFDKGSLAKARVDIKWLYSDRTVYVDVICIKDLFPLTFTPSRFLKSNGGNSARTINWKIKSIDDYVKIRRDYNQRIEG